MDLERDRDGLTWTLPVVRARWAAWVRQGGEALGVLAVGIACLALTGHQPYVDPAPGCPDGPACAVEGWSAEETEARHTRYLDAASCESPSRSGRALHSVPVGEVGAMTAWDEGPCHAWDGPAGRYFLGELEALWASHGAALSQQARVEATAVARAQARAAYARAWEQTVQTLGLALMALLAGALLWLGGRHLGRPVRLRVDSRAVSIGGDRVPHRYLRAAVVEGGRLVFEDVERTRWRTPVLVDAPEVGRVLPALQAHLGAERLTDEDLDALVLAIDPDRTAASSRFGGLALQWTHDGVRTVLHARRDVRLLALGPVGGVLIVLGLGVVGSLPILVPTPVWGWVSAEQCAAGDPRCSGLGVDDPSASIDAYARLRVCDLVDRPIAEASYHDAPALAAAARAGGFLTATEPCRSADWALGDPSPHLRALWLSGPRNSNVVDEAIAGIEQAAVAQIRTEWAALGGGDVRPWTSAIASARVWWIQLGAGGLLMALAGFALLALGSRATRSVTVRVEARRLVVEGRSFPYDAIREITVRDGVLRVLLDDGSRWESPPPDDPESTARLVEWVRGRVGAGTVPVPADLARMRAARQRE